MEALLEQSGKFLAHGRTMLVPGPGGRLFVCGCGDGLFAARAASGWAEEAGLDWRPIGALDLVLQAGRLTSADRVIAVSMSGNVDRTVEAATAAAQAAPVLALVNGGGGRLGAVAGGMVSLGLSDEAPFLCGTASYTATVVALMLLAAGASAREGMVDRLAAALPALTAAAAVAEQASPPPGWLPTGVRILAAGPEMGTACYGAAKLVELTRVPAWAADLEEFAHSHYWSMPTTDLVVVVATEPRLARHATGTCEALAGLGVVTMAVDADHAPVPSAAIRVTLPRFEPSLAPLASALPFQWLAYRVAQLSGLDPNTRLHLKADDARFRVSRLLTRLSLVGTGQ